MASLREMVDREAGSGHRGVGVLRRLVNEREPDYQPSASELQAATRRLLVAAGIPFVDEFVVTDDNGNFVARVDFKLVGSPVVVESDGSSLSGALRGASGPITPPSSTGSTTWTGATSSPPWGWESSTSPGTR